MATNIQKVELRPVRRPAPPIDARAREALQRAPGVTYRRGSGRGGYTPAIELVHPVDVLLLLGREEHQAQRDPQ